MINNDYIKGGTQRDFYNENDKEYCNCPLCNSNDFLKIYTEKGLQTVKCKKCELIYTNPRAKNSEQNYFGDANVFFNEARLIFNGTKRHHRDRNYEYELKKIKNIKRGGKLLDVGTNMGFFLRKAKEMGYETEGVEPSPALSEIARKHWKLEIHNSFLEKANLKPKNYDIITLIDVFEHITQPKEILDTCFKLLKDDGIIAIKVPNGDYNYFKMILSKLIGKNREMDLWDSYEHVVHYTPKTFKKMAELSGFKIQQSFIPIPVHSPVWANLVGHYFQYTSPFILDWKRIIIRNVFYNIGKIEFTLFGKTRFGTDLMFIIQKK